MLVSIYPNIKTSKNGQDLPLQAVLENIKNGTYQHISLSIANETDKHKRQELKKNLPYFTPSGTFSTRSIKGLTKHSGILSIDFDNLDDIDSLEAQLRANEYTFAVFRSVSQRGLCCLVKIDPEQHLQSFLELEVYYWRLFSASVDPSCKDVSRARFVSYDPNLYVNTESKPYVVTGEYQSVLVTNVEALIPITDYDAIIERLLKWWDLKFGFVDGQKNTNLLILAQSMNEYGISKDYALGYIMSNIVGDSSKEKEVTSVVNSAYNRTQSNIKQFEDRGRVNQVKQRINKGESPESVAKEFGITKEVAEKAATKPTSSNPMKDYRLWMKKQKLKRNVLTMEYENEFGQVMEEENLNSLYIEARLVFPKMPEKDFYTILKSLDTPNYNPLLDYFNSIKWDGKDRLTDLCNSVNSNTGTPDWRQRMITKWLVGMVNTVYNSDPNILNLVFAGEGNTGKTSFFRRLLPKEISNYMADSQLDQPKDDEILMSKKLIIFDDEYGGKSKTDAKKLKRLTSSPSATLRAAYAKKERTYKRLATLCGTCNELEILNDPTGNRRIIVIEAMGKFDFELYNSVDKTQLFGQIAHMVKNKFDCNLSDDEIELLKTYTASQYGEIVLEDELVKQYFIKVAPGGGEWMSTSMIKVYLEKETGQKLVIKRLGQALRASGFERVARRGIGYGYMVFKSNGHTIERGNDMFAEKGIQDPFNDELP